MKKIFHNLLVTAIVLAASSQIHAQVETPDAILSTDATWSQIREPSADVGLPADLNGESSITYTLVDATGSRRYPFYSMQNYKYTITLELVHSDGSKEPIEDYYYDNTSGRGWRKKNPQATEWGSFNGSTTTGKDSRGTIQGTVRFTYGQNGDKIRATIYDLTPHSGPSVESYFTIFEVRTIRYDLYDDRMLLGSDQNNLKDHTTPISIYVHRNLSSANWNTLCLPFDLPYHKITEVFGEGTTVSKFSDIDLQNHIVNFYTAPVKTEGIKAGQAYLIKPGKDFTTDNPFKVTGVKTSASVSASLTADKDGYGYEFTGILQPTKIKEAVAASQTPVYISGNHFYKETGETPMKGFRAYFKFPATYPDGSAGAPAKSMMLNVEESTTTAISNIKVDGKRPDTKIYNLNGQYVGTSRGNLSKGIYIVDGKKVVVR